MNLNSKIFYIILIHSLLSVISPKFLKFDNSEDYNIDKSISLTANADKIFKQKGGINFNILNDLYYNLTNQIKSQFNEIHITLSFNEEYHLLASVTIASILKNSDIHSYIYFHIIALNNLPGKIMEKIFSLRKK